MSNLTECPECKGTKWEIRGLELKCSYCGYVKTIEEQAKESLSGEQALEFLKEKEENRISLIFSAGAVIFIIIIIIIIFKAPISSFDTDSFSTELSPQMEKLEKKVEALDVVGETGKEATKEIKKIDSKAYIQYVKEKWFSDEEKSTSNLNLKVKEMRVDYYDSEHNVTLVLE